MSRDMYVQNVNQARSPKPMRREMPHVGQASPTSKPYSMPQSVSARASPITPAHHRQLASPSQPRKSRHIGGSRSSNSSPLTLPPEGHVGHVPHSLSSSAFNVTGSYYGYDSLNSPVMDTRSASASGHRSRSTTRGNARSYHSLERDHETEFIPIRDRSLDRGEHLHHRARDRSLDRLSLRDGGGIIDDDPYRDQRSARHSPNPDMRGHVPGGNRDAYIIDLQNQLGDMQKEYSSLKKELDMTNQKLGSSMHSIKTFWSPELKKERALRKEESAKYSLINDQLKLLNSENQNCQFTL
uniref:ERC protein 2 n=1 Tax=Strigamia maritima TaxID=126957 RepID=T1IYT5_STRMM